MRALARGEQTFPDAHRVQPAAEVSQPFFIAAEEKRRRADIHAARVRCRSSGAVIHRKVDRVAGRIVPCHEEVPRVRRKHRAIRNGNIVRAVIGNVETQIAPVEVNQIFQRSRRPFADQARADQHIETDPRRHGEIDVAHAQRALVRSGEDFLVTRHEACRIAEFARGLAHGVDVAQVQTSV